MTSKVKEVAIIGMGNRGLGAFAKGVVGYPDKGRAWGLSVAVLWGGAMVLTLAFMPGCGKSVSQRDKEARAKLQALGAKFELGRAEKTLVTFEKQIALKQFECIRDVQNLVLVDVTRIKIGDEGLRIISSIESVSGIDAREIGATDQGLKCLTQMPNLVYLKLSDDGITDIGAKTVSKIKALNTLYYSGELSADGFAYLCTLPNLIYFKASADKLTNEGIAPISRLTELNHLYLYKAQIDDEGLRHLKPLKHLTILSLDKSRITGKGLD